MNREQASHILDAYIELELDTEGTASKEAIDALRDVILDAMTEYKTTNNPWTITYPPKPIVTYTGTNDPNVVKPSVTNAG